MQANTPSGSKRRPVLQANTPSGSKRRPVLQANSPSGSKRRPVLHRSGLRGQKGGLFFTVLGCAVKKAARFLPFLTARSKRRSVLHSATPRGCCIGPSFRADYKTKPDTRWKSHHVPGKLRWRPKTPPVDFAGVRRRPGKFCCGGHRRLGQIRRRPQTPSVGR